MVAKPIKDAVKALKEIIDQNGLNYLADEPYRVYEKLLESGTADRKTRWGAGCGGAALCG